MKKLISTALLVIAVLSVAVALVGCGSKDIGIIGGADGPTSIIVS